MYYEPEDVPPIAHTTTLNEELGQIEYIFSDKVKLTISSLLVLVKTCDIYYGQ